MPRDPRLYITVANGMPEHPKIEGLSDAAFRLLLTTWCWCSRNLTDGKITKSSWEKRGRASVRRELVSAGLVDIDSTGDAHMHDYLEHQESASDVEERSRVRAEAGRKGGLAKQANRVASATANAKQMLKQTASKPVADIDIEQEIPTEVGSRVPVSNASADDTRGPVVDVSMVKLAKVYTDKVKLSNPGRVAAVCLNAIGAGYDQEQIRSGLTVLADEGRTVTADTLRIAIDGEAPKARGRPPATATTRAQSALDRAKRYAAESGQDLPQIGAGA